MIKLDLTPGTLYDYAPTSKREVNGVILIDRFVQGRYSILGTAQDAHTSQQQIVYKAEDGKDKDKWYICTPYDFMIRFIPVAAKPDPINTDLAIVKVILSVKDKPKEKIADNSEKGVI